MNNNSIDSLQTYFIFRVAYLANTLFPEKPMGCGPTGTQVSMVNFSNSGEKLLVSQWSIIVIGQMMPLSEAAIGSGQLEAWGHMSIGWPILGPCYCFLADGRDQLAWTLISVYIHGNW